MEMGEGSSGGCMTTQQVASTMKTVERGGIKDQGHRQ